MSMERKFPGTEMIMHTHEAMNLPNEVVWASDFAKEKLGMETSKEYAGPVFLWEPGQEVKGHFGARKFHHRSFSLDLPTQGGEPSIHISVKGAGYFNGQGKEQWTEEQFGTTWGLMSMEACELELRNSTRAKNLGVRVVEPIAIIRPKALPVRTYGGHAHIIPIEELRESGKLSDSEFEPGIYFRKGRSDTRLQDIIDEKKNRLSRPSELLRKELPHVIQELEKELGKELTPQKYVEWFTETLARNLGKMHSAGIAHHFLHSGNMTLAGEFLDNADFQDFSLPDMEKSVSFTNMHEALQVSNATQESLTLVEGDISFDADGDNDGLTTSIYSFAATVVDTFPESFKFDLKDWDDDSTTYCFEQMFPELEDTFWRVYLEEMPQLAFLHRGYNFPRQGEVGRA